MLISKKYLLKFISNIKNLENKGLKDIIIVLSIRSKDFLR